MSTRTGELFINGSDAFTTWGICFESSSLSALLTPASVKDYADNEIATIDGVSVVTDEETLPKLQKRSITLTFILQANGMSQFLSRYSAFCEQMRKGYFTLTTKYESKEYSLRYLSCSQFTQYNGRIAKFALKVEEPNPTR